MSSLSLPSFTIMAIYMVIFCDPGFALIAVALRHFHLRKLRKSLSMRRLKKAGSAGSCGGVEGVALVATKADLSLSLAPLPMVEDTSMITASEDPTPNSGEESAVGESDEEEEACIRCDLTRRAVEELFYALFLYIFFWLIFGSAALTGALHLRPNEPSLQDRGISRTAQAVFITISAFDNAGFSLSNSSIFYWIDNPLSYCIAALISTAGVALTPVFLHLQLYVTLLLKRSLLQQKVDHIEELLTNGEKYCFMLFPYRKTLFHLTTTMSIYFVLFCLFLFSIESHPDYASTSTIVGVGFYQAISARFSGLQLVDLNSVSRGMTFAYVFAMWIHTQPLVSAFDYLDKGGDLTVKKPKLEFSSSPLLSTSVQRNTASVPTKGRISTSSLASYLHFRLVNAETVIATCFCILTFTEDPLCQSDPATFNLWSIFFELMSAHSGCGLSFSPGESNAYSGAFSPAGKLVIITATFAGYLREPPMNSAEWLDLFAARQRKELGIDEFIIE